MKKSYEDRVLEEEKKHAWWRIKTQLQKVNRSQMEGKEEQAAKEYDQISDADWQMVRKSNGY